MSACNGKIRLFSPGPGRGTIFTEISVKIFPLPGPAIHGQFRKLNFFYVSSDQQKLNVFKNVGK